MGTQIIIKAILIFIVLALLIFFLENRNATRLKAGGKALFLLFIIGAIISIADPNLLNDIARPLGVGRGADLLLYALVLAFCFVTVNTYLKFKDYEQKIAKLTRELAIKKTLDKPSTGRKRK